MTSIRNGILVALLTSSASFAALAADQPVPGFIRNMDASEKFINCINADQAAKGLKDDDVPVLIEQKKLGGELVKRISAIAESPEEKAMLARAVGDKAQVEAVFALAEHRAESDTIGFGLVAILEQINIVEGMALESKCEIPAHLQPGGNPEREWALANEAALKDAMAFSECVDKAANPKAGDRFLEDAMPAELKKSVRAEMLVRASKIEGAGEQVTKIRDAQTIDKAMAGYMTAAMLTFDMRTMTEMNVYTGYYRNKFSNGTCTASDDVLRLGGVTVD